MSEKKSSLKMKTYTSKSGSNKSGVVITEAYNNIYLSRDALRTLTHHVKNIKFYKRRYTKYIGDSLRIKPYKDNQNKNYLKLLSRYKGLSSEITIDRLVYNEVIKFAQDNNILPNPDTPTDHDDHKTYADNCTYRVNSIDSTNEIVFYLNEKGIKDRISINQENIDNLNNFFLNDFLFSDDEDLQARRQLTNNLYFRRIAGELELSQKKNGFFDMIIFLNKAGFETIFNPYNELAD